MRRMNTTDTKAWMAKTERLNHNATLHVGDRVQDPLGRLGTVSEILWHDPADPDDHGSISVALDGSYEEHHHTINWARILRRLPAPPSGD